MKTDTLTELINFIAHGMCFSFKDAMDFAEKLEERELDEEEKSSVKYFYDKYRHFGF